MVKTRRCEDGIGVCASCSYSPMNRLNKHMHPMGMKQILLQLKLKQAQNRLHS